MANLYKGLTFRIGADTTDLNKGLRDAKREMSGVPTELRKIEKALKLDPGNTKLLAQQQADYRKAISSTEKQLEALRAAEQQIGRGGMSDEQWVRLQSDIAMCEQQLDGYRSVLADSIVRQNAMESALGSSGAKLEAFGDRLAPVGRHVEKVGGALTKTLTPALLAMGAAGVAAAIDVDDALTGVRKTVDGTEQQYQALKRAAVEFSKTNAVSASQILDIQALGAQLGYSIDELQEFGEVVSGLDIATNMDADTAATELAQFANIMGMSHDKTRNFGSTVVALGNSFATTEADISSMAMRIAGAAKSIGLTEADVLGLATAMASMGVEAEAGGTAISTIMASIDKAVAMNAESVADWASAANMSVGQFKRAWGSDAVGALSAVLVGMDAAVQSGGNMSQMLAELGITSIRQTDVMKRLANNSEFLGRAVGTANEAWRENTALDAEVANRNASLSAQFEMLKNRVFAIAESYGGPLCEAMLDVLAAAEPLIEALSSGARAFSEMGEEEQRTVLACLAMSAALGPMLTIAGKGMQAVSGLGKGMQSLAMFVERAKLRTAEQTAATQASTAAVKAQTTATKAQDAANKATAASTEAVGTASKAAGTGMRALRTAMMAVPAMALLSVATSLVPVLEEWAANLDKSAENTASLTAASREHADKVRSLKAAYDDAAEAQGESSDAAARARDAYEAEAEAFEQGRQTMSQFRDECAKVAEDHGSMVSSLSDARAEADKQAGSILNLADKVAVLLDVEGRSAEQRARLASYAEMLNKAMGREAVIYDQTADSCELTAEAVRDLAKAEADRLRGEAALSRYNSLMEDSVAVDSQLARAQEELEAASRGVGLWIGDFPVLADNASIAYHDLEKRVADLTDAQAENADGMEDALSIAQQMAAKDEALAQAVAAVRSGEMDAAEAAEAFSAGLSEGIGESEVAAQVFAEVGEEAEELSKKVKKIAEELDEYRATSMFFDAALEQSGWTSAELAQHLHDAGASAKDLTGAYEDLAKKATNAFDEIEQKQDISLEKMLGTMRKNREATESWSENLQALYEKAGDESQRRYINSIAKMGPEYALLVDELLNDTTGKLEQLAAEADAGMAAAGNAMVVQMGLARDGCADAAQGAAAAVELALSAMAERSGQSADEVAEKLAGLGASLEDLSGLTDEQLAALAESYDGTMESIAAVLEGFVADNEAAGDAAGKGLATEFGSYRAQMETAGGQLAGAAKGQLDRLPGIASSDGAAGGRNFATSLVSYQGLTRTNALLVADEAAKIGRDKDKSGEWGSHLVQNFANAIKSGTSWVSGAAKDIANVVAANLKHTVPKEGILHEGGEGEARWGRHAVENYARGMLQAVPDIEAAADRVAAAQSARLAGAEVSAETVARMTVSVESARAAAQTVVVAKGGDAELLAAILREISDARRDMPAVLSDSFPDKLTVNGREFARLGKESKGEW